MRNAGLLSGALIGLGYVLNQGMFKDSDTFASDEDTFMAEKKKRFRHTFTGDGQAEFEQSYLKFSKALPYEWIIQQGVAPLSMMITNGGYGGTNRHKLPVKGAYNKSVSQAIATLGESKGDEVHGAWYTLMHLITGQTNYGRNTPVSLPEKEQLFRLLIQSREWVKNHPQVRTLTDDSANGFRQGRGGRGGTIKMRMYGIEPKILAQGADYRIAIPTQITETMSEEDFNDHVNSVGLLNENLSYYGRNRGSNNWLSASEIPDDVDPSRYVRTKQKPEYYQNRYLSMVIIPPLDWWPTMNVIDGWYAELEEIWGGSDSPADAEMRQQWNHFKNWISHGTPEQPIPLEGRGYSQYNWRGGSHALTTLKRFKGMPDYSTVANTVKKNLRANIAMTKGLLKDL